MFVAIDKGYLRQQGLAVELTQLPSIAEMIAPLASDQVQVAIGGIGPGLFNAVARGIGMELVGTAAYFTPSHSYYLVARKSLVDSGGLKSEADLRGKTMAVSAPLTSIHLFYAKALQRGGLSFNDGKYVTLTFPDMLPALGNGNVDLAFLPEPFAASAVSKGIAVRWRSIGDLVPNQPAEIWLYSQKLAETQPDIAKRFMVAILHGERDYIDAFQKNRGREEVIAAMINHSPVKDRALYDQMDYPDAPPNGEVSLVLLQQNLDFFKAQGGVETAPDLSKVVDPQFAKYASEQLGPYH